METEEEEEGAQTRKTCEPDPTNGFRSLCLHSDTVDTFRTKIDSDDLAIRATDPRRKEIILETSGRWQLVVHLPEMDQVTYAMKLEPNQPSIGIYKRVEVILIFLGLT